MGLIAETVKRMEGYNLHIVNTDKFKTNTIVWKMKAPLTKDTVTKRALLPYVLQSRSEKFPTTEALRSYLEELYGADLFVDIAKKGEYQIVSFSIEIANEKFLSGEKPLLEKGLELLAEILLRPLTGNNGFDSDMVEKEKRTLKQRIQSINDDKMRYSSYRLIQEMCKEEPYALHVNGELDQVDSITAENLYEYFKQSFAQDELDLYVVGSVDAAQVEAAANKLFHFEARQPLESEKNTVVRNSQEKVVKEEQDVKQGKLNIGYRTNIKYGDEDYYALQVFNGIFGGFSHSKLFHHVREKNSLAYYVASRLESHKGLMMVMSGIESENYQLAVDIIHEQLQEMRRGVFSDEEIDQTKAVINNQMLETLDTSRGIVEVLYHNVVGHVHVSLDEWMEKMQNVSREEIIGAANKVELDTIYFLSGKGEE